MTRSDITDAIGRLDAERLTDVASGIEAQDSSYLSSYEALAEFFAATPFDQINDFIRAAHLVYAWMPRVLKLEFKADGERLDRPRPRRPESRWRRRAPHRPPALRHCRPLQR